MKCAPPQRHWQRKCCSRFLAPLPALCFPASARSLIATLKIQSSTQSTQSPHPPTSAWWKATMPVGSKVRHSSVDLPVTAKPNGMSVIEYTTTCVEQGHGCDVGACTRSCGWMP